jgi:hypothetical protein
MKIPLTVLAVTLLTGPFAASYAELPPLTPEEKAAAAAAAEKVPAEKAKAAKDIARAQDKAVSNYKKNKGSSSAGATTTEPGRAQSSAAPPAPSQSKGADHAKAERPDAELTRQEAQTGMPKPGQANDHSTTARDPKSASGR